MDRTVQEHVRLLELRITELNKRIMDDRLDLRQRNVMEAEIRAANSALAHFRAALQIEQQVLHG
jgi:hypothetical protein